MSGYKESTNMKAAFGHELDVRRGMRIVCYNQFKKCWVAPGRTMLSHKYMAVEMAERINEIIVGSWKPSA